MSEAAAAFCAHVHSLRSGCMLGACASELLLTSRAISPQPDSVYDALNKMCSAAGDPLVVKEGLRELEGLLQANATDEEWSDALRDKFLVELARAVSPSQVRISAAETNQTAWFIIALISP